RSLETLHMRMVRHTENAKRVAGFLNDHVKIDHVNYLGLLRPGTSQYEIYRRQCEGPGAMISFDILSDEAGVFRFLNALHLVRLAVSLGGTESLAQHPNSMTHAAVDPIEKKSLGISEGLVRLSVGIEDPEDLVRDLRSALGAV
ncbi:MAG: PLP-dependent transferase, partial [Acidimicrobiales bacterium]